jgi:hypothetical protein
MHEGGGVLKTGAFHPRLMQALALALKLLRCVVLELGIACGVRHTSLLPRFPTTAKPPLGSTAYNARLMVGATLQSPEKQFRRPSHRKYGAENGCYTAANNRDHFCFRFDVRLGHVQILR